VTNTNQLAGYCYDADGNLTILASCSSSGSDFAYDDENRLNWAFGWSYGYDAGGRRVSKTDTLPDGPPGTLYWYGKDGEVLLETDTSGNLLNEYVFLNGERVARRDSSGNVFYYFEDQIGSTRVITDSSGNVCYDADFFPFGGEQNVYTNTCPQNYKFTGKERDAETGLDYFGARYFSSSLGRFMTPDWAAKPAAVPYAKFGDPQSLNLYGYVENEPVNRIDADGHLAGGPGAQQSAASDKTAVPCGGQQPTNGICLGGGAQSSDPESGTSSSAQAPFEQIQGNATNQPGVSGSAKAGMLNADINTTSTAPGEKPGSQKTDAQGNVHIEGLTAEAHASATANQNGATLNAGASAVAAKAGGTLTISMGPLTVTVSASYVAGIAASAGGSVSLPAGNGISIPNKVQGNVTAAEGILGASLGFSVEVQ
jgi:RHS repeat-associated protein